ncbi:threonine/serine dehydratase [Kribbella sp. NBC_00382]|uniref:threonine/serine dehydratase n=1 Tax=Kribbella sp. NBC_00382 TaxID=2975967 RepID=UPI002E1B3602
MSKAPSPTEIAARSEQTAPKLRQHLPPTPLERYAAFGEELDADVLVKSEHRQRTGSFKARGSMAKLLTLTAEERERGVVTASTGNHALGVGNALATLGGRGIVYLPENASPSKVAALKRFGLEIRAEGTDSGVLEPKARAYAAEHDLTYISPYNDPDIIAGQGTAAVEILEQLQGNDLDAVVVAVGGGGLISGIAAVLKEHRPDLKVYGASPERDAAMAASIAAGQIIAIEGQETLSDGTAGSIEPGSITFDLCRQLVDDWVLVSEDAIKQALRTVIDTEHQLIEGSAAMAFAAARARHKELQGKRVAIVSCGGNISSTTLAKALA